MSGRAWRGMLLVVIAGVMAGCGGGENGNWAAPGGPAAVDGKRRVHLVGFDASEPIVSALQQGKIEGVGGSEPPQDGGARRQDAGQAPGEKPVEPKISTGETLVTAREHEGAEQSRSLIDPPKVGECQRRALGREGRRSGG